MLGHGTATTTGRGWQGELWDSEEDTWELLQELELEEVVELGEEERLRRKIVERAGDGAMTGLRTTDHTRTGLATN